MKPKLVDVTNTDPKAERRCYVVDAENRNAPVTVAGDPVLQQCIRIKQGHINNWEPEHYREIKMGSDSWEVTGFKAWKNSNAAMLFEGTTGAAAFFDLTSIEPGYVPLAHVETFGGDCGKSRTCPSSISGR